MVPQQVHTPPPHRETPPPHIVACLAAKAQATSVEVVYPVIICAATSPPTVLLSSPCCDPNAGFSSGKHSAPTSAICIKGTAQIRQRVCHRPKQSLDWSKSFQVTQPTNFEMHQPPKGVLAVLAASWPGQKEPPQSIGNMHAAMQQDLSTVLPSAPCRLKAMQSLQSSSYCNLLNLYLLSSWPRQSFHQDPAAY